MNTAVIVVIAILALGALAGVRKGFVKTVFTLGSTLVAILLTVWLNPYVSNMMQNSEKIMTYVTTRVEENIEFDDEDSSSKKESDDEFIKGLKLPSYMQDSLIKNNNNSVYEALSIEKQNIKHYVSVYVAVLIVKALSFIVTFIVVSLLLGILCHLLDIMAKLPVLNALNKVLGLVAGVAEGLVFIWLLCVVLTAIAETKFGMSIYAMVDESSFLQLIYEHNLITQMIGL